MLTHTYNHWNGAPSINEILDKSSRFPSEFEKKYTDVSDFMIRAAEELFRTMKSSLKFRFDLSLETYQLSILNHEVNKNLDYLSSRLNSDSRGGSIVDSFHNLDFQKPDDVKHAVLYLVTRFAVDDKLANLKIDHGKIEKKGELSYYYFLSQEYPCVKDIVQIVATYVYHIWLIMDYGATSSILSKVVLRKKNGTIPEKNSDKIFTTRTIPQITALGQSLIKEGLINPKTPIGKFLLIFFDERDLDDSLVFFAKYHDDFRKRLKIHWMSHTNLFAYLFMSLERKGWIRKPNWQSELSQGFFIDKKGDLFKAQALSKIISDHQSSTATIKKAFIIDEIIKNLSN